jgi:hypothetical protein
MAPRSTRASTRGKAPAIDLTLTDSDTTDIHVVIPPYKKARKSKAQPEKQAVEQADADSAWARQLQEHENELAGIQAGAYREEEEEDVVSSMVNVRPVQGVARLAGWQLAMVAVVRAQTPGGQTRALAFVRCL